MKKPSPNDTPTANGGDKADAPGSVSVVTEEEEEECGNCGTKKGWVLHNVRYRTTLRRLCTSCVLRLHPAHFCPFCFLLLDHNYQTAPHSHPPRPSLVSCSNCPSLSHADCLPPPYAAFSPSSFLCPPCASKDPPAYSFFQLGRVLDKHLAAVLICAARIAANSMSKAVAIARAEADRRVREAATARKRAREALDRLVLLSDGGGGTVQANNNGQHNKAQDKKVKSELKK